MQIEMFQEELGKVGKAIIDLPEKLIRPMSQDVETIKGEIRSLIAAQNQMVNSATRAENSNIGEIHVEDHNNQHQIEIPRINQNQLGHPVNLESNENYHGNDITRMNMGEETGDRSPGASIGPFSPGGESISLLSNNAQSVQDSSPLNSHGSLRTYSHPNV